MSDVTKLARPYAKAIFQMASETKTLDEWSSQLHLLSSAFKVDAVRTLLQAPKLGMDERVERIKALLDKELTEDAKRFIHVLAYYQRLLLIDEIAKLYEQYKTRALQVAPVTVETPFALTEAQKLSLQKALEKYLGQTVELNEHLNTKLLGGALLRAGDRIIDGSLKGRLERLAMSLNTG